MISVYVTCKDLTEARKIAGSLLEKKLIACANTFPVESMFRWKNKINRESEVAMFCKADGKNFDRIEAEIKKLHSYELPCIIAFGWAKQNKEFSRWVKSGG